MHTYMHTLQYIYIYMTRIHDFEYLHVDEFDHNLTSFSVTGMMVNV